MTRAPRRYRIGPPVVVLGTALLLTALMPASSIGVTMAAAGRGQPPGASACPPASDVAKASHRARADAPGRVRFDPVLSDAGELTGQLLNVISDAGALAVELPTESFVGQPLGELFVYTTYSPPNGSSVHLIDIATGCDVVAVSRADVVRSAVLAPDGASIYVHTLSRAGRGDNGVQRVDLAGSASTMVVPPLPPSDAFGPTFGTELRWSVDGHALAVQSCGFEACRTRVLDVATGGILTLDDPQQGALIGLTDRHLVTFAACAGLPCGVLSADLVAGLTTVLADTAWSAAMVGGPDGSATVSIQAAAGTTEVLQ